MKNLLKVRLHDLSNYTHLGVGVKKAYAQEIKRQLKYKFGTFENVAKLIEVHSDTVSKIEKRCTRFHVWNKILSLLDLPLVDLQPHVIKICDKYIYHINFPYTISPLHIRLVTHILGDGVYHEGSVRWIQKDAEPILRLQRKLLGISGNKWKSGSVEQGSIMSFYVKLTCSALGIERKDIKSAVLLDVCKKLPRSFGVEAVAAIIEDESRIQPISASIRIAMKEIKIVETLADLMDSLGYDRSEVKKVENNGSFNSSEPFLYQVFLRVLGAHKFYRDLQNLSSQYGELANLWTKRRPLEMLISNNDGRNAKGRNINNILIEAILKYVHKKEIITCNQLRKIFNVTHNRMHSAIGKLLRHGQIERVTRGNYRILTNS